MYKHLNKRYTMYVKNLNFFLNRCFKEKMVELKKTMKLICSSFPRKISPQPLSIRLPPEFQQLFNPHLLITNLKMEEAQRTKHSIVPRVFLCILVYVSTMY